MLALTSGPHTFNPLWGKASDRWHRNPRPVLPHPLTCPRLWIWKQEESGVKGPCSVPSDNLTGPKASQHPYRGRCCRETRGHMKINLPVFKDEDMKDAITYQSWRWNLTVYCCAGCWDHTLIPYTIWSLQGYLGEHHEELWDGHNLWTMCLPSWMNIIITSKHWML